jgi:citrate lyase subunit beta/citryl-CoA lyase
MEVTMATVRLERSVLLVPGSSWKMIEKASRAGADAVCIDLEDAVAVIEKEAARANVRRAFRELDFGRALRMFRMNGLDTPYALRDLVEVVQDVGDKVDIIVVPKVGTAGDVEFVDRLLTLIESDGQLTRRSGVEALIETAAGCVNVREIAAASPRLEALVYGSGDYAASVQMPMASIGELDEHDEAYPGHRWHHVMHAIVSAARANGLRAIDGPFAGIRNVAGLERACAIGRAMGFDGKWCIHPSQLDPVNATFVPSARDLAWAQTVVGEYEAAVRDGRGAISVDGRMIDMASVRICQAAVERARLAGMLP